jgi:hypothetical protein
MSKARWLHLKKVSYVLVPKALLVFRTTARANLPIIGYWLSAIGYSRSGMREQIRDTNLYIRKVVRGDATG